MLDIPSSEVVKGTGYRLHSPVSPSIPLPCVTVCHHISTGLYFYDNFSTRNSRFCVILQCVLKYLSTSVLLLSFGATAPPLPPVGQGRLIHEVSRSHTTTHHSRYDSSGRVIRSCTDLYLRTHNTHNRHPCPPSPRWDSNPQSQQANGRRSTP